MSCVRHSSVALAYSAGISEHSRSRYVPLLSVQLYRSNQKEAVDILHDVPECRGQSEYIITHVQIYFFNYSQ